MPEHGRRRAVAIASTGMGAGTVVRCSWPRGPGWSSPPAVKNQARPSPTALDATTHLFVRADVLRSRPIVNAHGRCDDGKVGARGRVVQQRTVSAQGFVPPEDFALDDFNRVMTVPISAPVSSASNTSSGDHEGAGRRQHHQQRSLPPPGSPPMAPARSTRRARPPSSTLPRCGPRSWRSSALRVNCISPGAIVTPIFWGWLPDPGSVEAERAPRTAADRALRKRATA